MPSPRHAARQKRTTAGSGRTSSPLGTKGSLPRSQASTSRDPALVTIYGTNDAIADADNGFGNSENWTVIVANLPYAAPDARGTVGPLISFPNGAAWNSYKIEIVDNKGPDTAPDANSIQFAEVQLFSGSVPEPSIALVAVGGAAALVARRRRS